MTTGYPAILLVEGRRALVVGGGAEGERKVRSLADAGARVAVIATDPTEAVGALADAGAIDLAARAFEPADLDDAAVVVTVARDEDVREAVFRAARAAGVPVNTADDPARSTFIAPAILRRGDLVVAVTTGGTSPALAVRVRDRLAQELGEEYAVLLEIVARLKRSAEQPGDPAARAAGWYRVVDGGVLDLIRAGETAEAEALAARMLRGLPEEEA